MDMEPTFPQESPSVPFLISWNITKKCNLQCAHCYLDAGEIEGRDDISTAEAKRFIDEMASLNPHAMLILTGGEPLLRQDCTELSRYASGLGLTVVLGTNGTLLDDDTVRKLILSGIKGVGISLDSTTPHYHNCFRGVDGTWEKTIAGIEAIKRRGLDFQIQMTVTKGNQSDIPELIEFAHKHGARAINIFFLVCTGRGQNMTDLEPDEYEKTLRYLVEMEKELEDRIMVRARCAPHFLRVAWEINPDSPVLKGETSGCIAGRGYLRISPEGFVTPCPYMPVGNGGANLKNRGLKDIWSNDPLFLSLRTPVYKGRCGECEFSDLCGGCRARALSFSGDIMGEDPWCEYKPVGRLPKIWESDGGGAEPVWTEAAETRLNQVPVFLRSMVKRGVEGYAKFKGINIITPEIMAELKKKAGR